MFAWKRRKPWCRKNSLSGSNSALYQVERSGIDCMRHTLFRILLLHSV
jgi:hypothetical protein